MNDFLLALDPGTLQTGFVMFTNGRVQSSGVLPNEDALKLVVSHKGLLVIEMVASFGMPVGKEVFETVRWIGRFQQAYSDPDAVSLIYRRDVKLHLCGTVRAKDANVRQALIDKIGPQGCKASPGPTYGVKSHAWAALAVAVTFDETMRAVA